MFLNHFQKVMIRFTSPSPI